ncbi:MAG: tetratricopeptide repeat protein [Caldimonas sp.]
MLAAAALAITATGAAAQTQLLSATATAAPKARPAVETSALDAPLFYQLLIAEITLRGGDLGSAYQLFLDAARRAKDEQLFHRATDVALQARAGDQALASVLAWREALPESQDALRYHVQLLVALNRLDQAEEPMATLLERTPVAALPETIAAVPRFLSRSPDHAAVASLVERVMKPYVDRPPTRSAALVATGRAWLAAAEPAKALALAEQANAADPEAEGPALLALDLMPGTPAAEQIVRSQLAAKPASTSVRLLYVRTLATTQRLAEAAEQLQTMTGSDPSLAPPWLTLGALELELHHPKEATRALETYVGLVENGGAVTLGQAPAADSDDDAPASTSTALTQAWLLLAQAAEQDKDFSAAERWLARIDNPKRALDVQSRRASLLARQGRMAEARELIHVVPEQSPADARAKLVAEAELLRNNKDFAAAETVLVAANKAFPDDTDLLYEQAMVEEKLDRLDRMEQLLRRVIALKPDHQHAYNALGYSLAERKIRLPEARSLIQKALELSPGEPFITDSLGWVEYRLGNNSEAIRLLRDAYRSRPDPEIAAHLGEVLWNAGQTDEARKVWREGRSRDSSNDVLRETLARLRVNL